MGRDPVKALIEEATATYVYVENLPINQINHSLSRQNDARPEHPLVQSRVAYNVQMFKDGKIPPPIIVRQLDTGEYVILDGNHRDEAARRAGIEFLPAYVILDQDTSVLRWITVIANNRLGGEGGSIQDLYINGAKEVLEGKLPIEEVARRYHLNVSTLGNRVRGIVAAREMTALDIDTDRYYNDSMLYSMYSLLKKRPVLLAVDALVNQYKINDTHLKQLLPLINRQKSEKDQLEEVRKYAARSEMKSLIRRTYRKPLARQENYAQFFSRLRLLEKTMEPAKVPSDLALTDPSVEEEAREIAQKLIVHLRRVFFP